MKQIEYYDVAFLGAATELEEKINEIIEVVNELMDRSQSSYMKWDIDSPETWQGATSETVIMKDKQEPSSTQFKGECIHIYGFPFCPVCGEDLQKIPSACKHLDGPCSEYTDYAYCPKCGKDLREKLI